MNTKLRTYYFMMNIAIPIIGGVFIYIIARPDTYISQWIYRLLGVSLSSEKLRVAMPSLFWIFICNYAADILWAYSLTFAVCIVLSDSLKNYLPIFIICIVFEIIMELSQLLDALPGTFDLWDIALEICATVIASLNIKHIRRKINESV